jgi:hypothetical protein
MIGAWLLLAIQASQSAAAPPPPIVLPPVPDISGYLRKQGFSEAGAKLISRGAIDHEVATKLLRVRTEQIEASYALGKAAASDPANLDEIELLLARQAELKKAEAQLENELLLRLLKALSEADRQLLLQQKYRQLHPRPPRVGASSP